MEVEVKLSVPSDVSDALKQHWGDLSRHTLENLAIEGYQARLLSESQVRRMLGFETRAQVHQFLKDAGIYLDYGLDDLRDDLETHRKLGILPRE